jgi:hypothetical protein
MCHDGPGWRRGEEEQGEETSLHVI